MVLQYIKYFTHCVLYYSTCNHCHTRQWSLANKDTLHNRDSKGMFVYMEYSYLQERFLFINYFESSFQTKYQIHLYSVYKSQHENCHEYHSTQVTVLVPREIYLHVSINTKVISQNLFLIMVTIERKHSNDQFAQSVYNATVYNRS